MFDQKVFNPPVAGETIAIGRIFGVHYKVLSEATAGTVSVIEHALPPKTLAAPPHRHRFEDEVSYVLAGEIAVLQGNELTIAGPGSYVVKPRGVWHTFWNPSAVTTARHIEIIAPGGFENYFKELAGLVPVEGPPDLEGIFALAARYGLEFDMGRLPEVEEKYGVSLQGTGQPEIG